MLWNNQFGYALEGFVYCNTKDYNEAFVKENEDDIEILRNKHFESHKLNVSQASAIFSAVNAVKKKEHPCIKLIQGPPGTGKTSMWFHFFLSYFIGGTKYLCVHQQMLQYQKLR
jgi:2-phosphoglycerate kinase